MRRMPRRKIVISTTMAILLVGAVGGRQLYVSRPGYGLPYVARFAADSEDHWTSLGGTWEIADGAMRNDSNDRGAKILTGSSRWRDYAVEADLQLSGSGSVGILARVSEAEVGENSYKGYWAGVRNADNSLVVGVFDFAYHEAAKVAIPEPVRPFRWYHVRLQVTGCRITASAWADGMQQIRTAPVNDPDCFQSGAIGLRSNGTGGIWRNVRVIPADSSTTTAEVRVAHLPDTSAALQALLVASGDGPPVAVQPINSLQYLSPVSSPVASVRGSVVLTRPAVYVQDATGGVEVQAESATPLKLGDEVEVTGEVNLEKFSPVIRKARVHLLREGVPLSPFVLSANQVAVGSYDNRFVQLEGYLRKVSYQMDGKVVLDIDAGTQPFHAVLPAGRSHARAGQLALESRLRLRGISVTDPRFNNAADPFVILVPAAEDVDVVAGPPWWRPSTLILAALVALALAFTINYLYLLAKHWRLRAVADERERLAHEIHDTLAQSFAGIGFQLQAIRNSVPRGASALEGQVDLAMSMARTSHEEARRSIATLRPKSLGNVGLLPALRECAERMVKNGNVAVETSGEEGGRTVPPRIKDTLFRIGQEAIANSIRHARPGTIRITLQRTRTSVCLSVEDDGNGFVADSHRAGFGLLGMRKRAESISATLTVRSTPGSGTRVEVKATAGSGFLPVPWLRPRLSVKDI